MLDKKLVSTMHDHNAEELKQRVEAKEKELLARYVPAHKVISREVFEEDLMTINKEAEVMYKLLFCRYGKNRGAHAIAHSQIEDKKPLRFFVTQVAIIINPKILRHTKVPALRREGCMTFPDREHIFVPRFVKMEVEFQTIEVGKNGSISLSPKVERTVKGVDAEVFQHEIDHMDGKYIYDIEEK